MADKYVSVHTGQEIDSAVTKALNPSTTFTSEDAGKLADAKAVGELVTAEKERAEATYLPYDGYSQLARVGEADIADNLTPFSGDSGTSQNTPFILQGSGCANGEEQADTGSYCQLQRKNGNTVTVNQNIKTSVTPFSATSKGLSFSCDAEGIVTVTGTIADSTISDRPTFSLITLANSPIALANRKYLFKKIMLKNNSTTANNIKYGGIVFSTWDLDIGCAFDSRIVSPSSNIANNLGLTYIVDDNSTALDRFHNGDVIDEKFKLILIDLTLWFVSNDKIPTHLLNHPEDFFRYYQGDLSYNVGTLTDSNGRYLKTTGRNVCDEVFEGGLIRGGSDTPDTDGFRTKNYQRVAPNTPYHLHSGIEISGYYVHEYDSNKNYLKSTSIYENNQVITLSPNTIFVRLSFWKSDSGWSSNVPAKDVAQIVLSLYYEGESGYDQYYPYEELANIDTGNEVLRSAGDACDYKLPSGEITRNIIRLKLKDIDFGYATTYTTPRFIANLQPDGVVIDTSVGVKANAITNSNYTLVDSGYDNAEYLDKSYYIRTGYLHIVDSAYTDATTFTNHFGNDDYILVQLATPTTEQGTPFAENVAIDDFGTMAFDCPNGVPQGNLIFYPVDYKAEIDTLHNITEGDMHKIALKGDLAPTDPDTIKGVVDYTAKVKNEAQDACGGTLRLLLSVSRSIDFSNTAYVDMGDLDWSVVEGNAYANCQSMSLSSVIKIDTSADYIYSTKYKAHSSAGAGSGEDMQIYISSAGGVRVNDFALNGKTAAQIKDAMNGVLLAYEKATT